MLKRLYLMKINGKRNKGSERITFVREAWTLKECIVVRKYYQELGYDVFVETYQFKMREKFCKKQKDYIDSDAYYYKGSMYERDK